MFQSLKPFKSVVVLTGAGVSAESGLKTFRDNDGLWENHSIEDVCTPEGFARNPALVYSFYNARRQQLLNSAQPNAAHQALARFEREFKGSFTLVTQNVDNLHEQAGSQNVLHMHGELLKARCSRSEKVFDINGEILVDTPCPHCQQTLCYRPHIVWFGEIPLYMDEIEQALTQCDLFVAIGTSGNVYPAAGFVELAATYGAHTVELNLEPSARKSVFQEGRYGPASSTVTQFFAQLV